MLNEAEKDITSTVDPNSDLKTTVDDKIISPPKMDTDRPPYEGYQLHDTNSKNKE
jgi:conjugal transfer mating pair stabilization protein TraG